MDGAQTEDGAVEELLLAEAALAEAKSSAPRPRASRASGASPALRTRSRSWRKLWSRPRPSSRRSCRRSAERSGAERSAERSGVTLSHTQLLSYLAIDAPQEQLELEEEVLAELGVEEVQEVREWTIRAGRWLQWLCCALTIRP